MDLEKIARNIKELEDMPKNEEYYEACILVAEDVWGLNHKDAIEVANIIQNDLPNFNGGTVYDDK